jgi:hypothetical protein
MDGWVDGWTERGRERDKYIIITTSMVGLSCTDFIVICLNPTYTMACHINFLVNVIIPYP